MATEKYLMISLNEEKARKIADILGNKTCKKILDFLAEEKEASEKDIASMLNVPINTVEYNLKKLLESGLIEKTKNFFWSKKGRKINMYKLAKKHIIISHKSKPSYSKLKSVLPVALISGAFAFVVRVFYQTFRSSKEMIQTNEKFSEEAVMRAAESVEEVGGTQIIDSSINLIDKIFALPAWLWFLTGALIAIILMLILNWRKL